ncbi:MAG TPA: polysaccharide biosynthesis/export family protein [Verrucomicrobiae bacterium]|nr:polysaccharide biosynthesis/export family protein [Verrucomicrobiae bacterium]
MKNPISHTPWPAPFATVQRLLLLFAVLIAISGCQSEELENTPILPPHPNAGSLNSSTQSAQSMVLREGDTLAISIPGSPTLDTTQQIRTDGKINLPLIGEVTASGKTPETLQNELLDLYRPQVSSAKQVIVTVQSPNIPVYVIGAVLRPGPVTVNHPLTVLDAVMEAGGFDYTKANLRSVVIVRQEKNRTVRYKRDLKKAMAGSNDQPFYLEPFDIVYVPERFTWY